MAISLVMFMRVPEESLDDFTNINATRKPAEPPPVRLLRLSGRYEALKPLARSTDRAERSSATGSRSVRPVPSPGADRFSWYHRSVAFSAGLAAIALIVGIIASFYTSTEPAAFQGGLDINRQSEAMLESANEPDTPAFLPSTTASGGYDKPYAVRSTVRRKLPRPIRAYYRPRQPARTSHLVMSSFVPTTLIIYIENGEIKTRIEPQLTAGYKKRS
ncbi:MAG: hypothetical protein WBD27_10735 [Pyrinomonadaceae bacterium]